MPHPTKVRVANTIDLSDLINAWDIIHVRDTGELGFSDLCDALESVGIHIYNDIPQEQPTGK